MERFLCRCLPVLLFSLCSHSLHASSAIWKASPGSGDWNTAANWTPEIVPTDVATFGVSTQTNVSVTSDTEIGMISFGAGASSFTIQVAPSGRVNPNFTISGTGIANNSGVSQNFVFLTDASNHSGTLELDGTATVSPSTVITLQPNQGHNVWGASTFFDDQASAGNGTFYSRGPSITASYGGAIYFYGSSTAGNATLSSDGASVSGAGGGTVWFWDSSTAGNAVITCNGGTGAGAGGGYISFTVHSSTGNATLIANAGVNGGGGGQILFDDNTPSDTSQPRVEVFGNGLLAVDTINGTTLHVGSIEGDGIIHLGNKQMIVGGNNLDTNFTGSITGANTANPALIKVGTGTLTLSGVNSYKGTTTVTEGALLAANTTGSATGLGLVAVNAGTFGGSGIVAGAVTVGTGSGSGAVLAPAFDTSAKLTLTVQNTLTLNSDATYVYTFRAKQAKARTDLVIANGVTINGAVIDLEGMIAGTVRQGTVLTVISNTSGNPIAGTFSNLPDGAIVNVGSAKFQASYAGGDGNDLTLTVIP